MAKRTNRELDYTDAPEEDVRFLITCGWCGRSIAERESPILGTDYCNALAEENYYCDAHCLYWHASVHIGGTTALEGLSTVLKRRFKLEDLVYVYPRPLDQN